MSSSQSQHHPSLRRIGVETLRVIFTLAVVVTLLVLYLPRPLLFVLRGGDPPRLTTDPDQSFLDDPDVAPPFWVPWVHPALDPLVLDVIRLHVPEPIDPNYDHHGNIILHR